MPICRNKNYIGLLLNCSIVLTYLYNSEDDTANFTYNGKFWARLRQIVDDLQPIKWDFNGSVIITAAQRRLENALTMS